MRLLLICGHGSGCAVYMQPISCLFSTRQPDRVPRSCARTGPGGFRSRGRARSDATRPLPSQGPGQPALCFFQAGCEYPRPTGPHPGPPPQRGRVRVGAVGSATSMLVNIERGHVLFSARAPIARAPARRAEKSTRPLANYRAGSTTPVQVPKPMRFAPSTSQYAVMVTSSPSWRNLRSVPSGSVIGCWPRHVRSRRQPRESSSGPETVPEAMRSPGADVAAGRAVVDEHLLDRPVHVAEVAVAHAVRGRPLLPHRGRGEVHLDDDVESERGRRPEVVEHGRVLAAPRSGAGRRNGARASIVTTHGLTEVQKFFALNGPSGWYSHFCTSRADQSFTMHRPAMWSSASAIVMRSPLPLRGRCRSPSRARSRAGGRTEGGVRRLRADRFCRGVLPGAAFPVR